MPAAAAAPIPLLKNVMMSFLFLQGCGGYAAEESVLIGGGTDAPYRLDAHLACFMLLLAVVTMVSRKRHRCLGWPCQCDGRAVTCRIILDSGSM